jgi:hypothetical protein
LIISVRVPVFVKSFQELGFQHQVR